MPDQSLTFTLLADGTSDSVLIPLLTLVLQTCLPDVAINSVFANPDRLLPRPRNLAERIERAIDIYPCEVLFVHRDAEKEPRSNRIAEITATITELAAKGIMHPYICVIPVRMTEAWLLFDEAAIRQAANNPNGRNALAMPSLCRLENLPDPKTRLFDLLRSASELPAQRRRTFDVYEGRRQVARRITDYRPLLQLSAFQALDADVKAWVAATYG